MSAIEWTDATWNPAVGCSRVSAGCEHCYAERVAHRGMSDSHRGLTVMGKHGPRWTGEVRFLPDRLDQPLRWRKPRRVFVNSMSDLFHEGLSFEQIDQVFGVMWACRWLGRFARPGHTFQILTKRAGRMLEYLSGEDLPGRWARAAVHHGGGHDPDLMADSVYYDAERAGLAAHPRIQLLVSVEDQATADERILLLLQCPAAVRGVSYEPALGPVDFGLRLSTWSADVAWASRWVRLPRPVRGDLPWLDPQRHRIAMPGTYRAESNPYGALSLRRPGGLLGIKPREFEALPALDWVIVGGESGPGARPFDLAWARSVVAQCKAAGVPCFVKQLGARPILYSPGDRPPFPRLKHRKGADMSEWPEGLRVREFPVVG